MHARVSVYESKCTHVRVYTSQTHIGVCVDISQTYINVGVCTCTYGLTGIRAVAFVGGMTAVRPPITHQEARDTRPVIYTRKLILLACYNGICQRNNAATTLHIIKDSNKASTPNIRKESNTAFKILQAILRSVNTTNITLQVESKFHESGKSNHRAEQ